MSGKWASSTRRSELPADWPAIRAAVARRAHGQCEWVGEPIADDQPSASHPEPSTNHRCTNAGTDCDHRDNRNNRNNHSINALQWLCHAHHAHKTQAEAQAAADEQRALLSHPATRAKHPGLI